MQRLNSIVVFNNIYYKVLNKIDFEGNIYYLLFNEKYHKFKVVYEFNGELYQLIFNDKYKIIISELYKNVDMMLL